MLYSECRRFLPGPCRPGLYPLYGRAPRSSGLPTWVCLHDGDRIGGSARFRHHHNRHQHGGLGSEAWRCWRPNKSSIIFYLASSIAYRICGRTPAANRSCNWSGAWPQGARTIPAPTVQPRTCYQLAVKPTYLPLVKLIGFPKVSLDLLGRPPSNFSQDAPVETCSAHTHGTGCCW